MLDALLSPAAAKLYEKLVRGTAVRIVRETNTDPGCTGSPAYELMQLGLLKRLPLSPDKLLPVQPAEAVATVMDRMWGELRQNQGAMATVLGDMEELQRTYTPAGGDDLSFGEVMIDAEEISVRHAALTDSARSEILAFGTPRTIRPGGLPVVIAPSDPHRRKQIDARSVYSADCVSAWGAGFFAELLATGERIRLASDLPAKMKIVDRRQALVGLDETGTRCALLVHAPALVALLRLSFESAWERAVPYQGGAADFTAREREVLVLLATGDKDETIAKKLNVGVRTVRRHISSAMQKLGTESRFAAGVQAVKRGWL